MISFLSPPPQKCGFVAVIGVPNAGKSTLINALVGQKVSIVSPKVQTTRQRILGIALHAQSQVILIDTPGIFSPKKRLDKAMVSAAWSAQKEGDVVLVVTDASRRDQEGTHKILSYLERQEVVLILNKIDKISKEDLISVVAAYQDFLQIKKVFMVSARKKDGVEDVLAYCAERLPVGPWVYPEDQITDLPQRLWAAEVTREQIFLQLQQELPYDTWVETESWDDFDNGSVKVNQVIYVARESQKAIVLGRRGARIKAISEAARHALSYSLERQVHLFIHVKHMENWQERPLAYRMMNLDF